MVIAKDEKVARHIKHLSTQAKQPGNEYIHTEIGFNYRLTNLQAALGCAQLEQIDNFLANKRRIAEAYRSHLRNVTGITFQKEASWAHSAWWLFTIRIDETKVCRSAREIIAALADASIASRPLWQPISASPAHGPQNAHTCPVASGLFDQAVSLPSSVSLDDEAIEKISAAVLKAHHS
jgi:perosamine synthetase